MVDDEIKAAAVVGRDACCSRMGEPLLWHDLTFGADGLSRHADPRALDDFSASGQQACPRASEGMVAIRVDDATTSQ